MIPRLTKGVLVALCALQFAAIFVNNVVDYGANWPFVQHVMTMDTVFPDNRDSWRAMHSEWQHRLCYALIIGWEGAAAALLAWGAVRLARRGEKDVALAGLTFSLLLWLGGFLIVGGEWFMMWQSEVWNGVNAAGRNFAIHGIVLVYVGQPD